MRQKNIIDLWIEESKVYPFIQILQELGYTITPIYSVNYCAMTSEVPDISFDMEYFAPTMRALISIDINGFCDVRFIDREDGHLTVKYCGQIPKVEDFDTWYELLGFSSLVKILPKEGVSYDK